ncbi:MAG: hypothetical protein BWX99_02798 [Deltaproteobacteria bacterium ADurb.Bin151]|nr:MAG: hypothetical protein BWX99_02798 [Deltaproteobacteria bacterium ADurb.Bin151]
MNGNIAPAIYDAAPVSTVPQNSQALVEIEQQRAMAEVQSAIVLAKKFRRNQIEAMDRITTACQRPGLAEQAVYEYARGGNAISGPSIRLAEALAQNWGNIQFGVKELDQRNGVSTVQAYAWDMETNVRQEKTFQVKHERSTKKGKYALEDSRDIYEMVANQGARRLRACILGVIPGDVIDAAVGQCEETLKAKADTSPEALKKLVEAFGNYKVTKEQIEKRIQRRLDTITPAQLIQLRKIYNSLKDGMSGPADWFETVVVTSDDDPHQKTDLKTRLREKAKEAVAPDPEAAPEEHIYAKTECPDHPGNTYNAEYCASCAKRQGCPAW